MSDVPPRDEPRNWEGSTFDPRSIRHCSILPDEDADEAYCVRHDREMQSIISVVHHGGALYTTTETFACYTCRPCLLELFEHAARSPETPPIPDGAHPKELLRAQISDMFGRWDDGAAAGDWFRYCCEEHRDGLREDKRYVWLAETRADAHQLIADDGRGDPDE